METTEVTESYIYLNRHYLLPGHLVELMQPLQTQCVVKLLAEQRVDTIFQISVGSRGYQRLGLQWTSFFEPFNDFFLGCFSSLVISWL